MDNIGIIEYLFPTMNTQNDIEARLGLFDASERLTALKTLAAEFGDDLPEEGSDVNMHFHSFFSFNAEDWSPSRIAWESRKAGLYAAGLCDFDVLDGLEEFIEAGLVLGLRSTVNLETRAFVEEFADVDINSPGEAGVAYVMGAGFAAPIADGTAQAEGLQGYRDRARARNIALVERINAALPDIAIDYGEDVLPLTPTGGATERHIVRAYTNKARDVFEHPEPAAQFWTGILGKDLFEMIELLADLPALEDVVRAKLVKRGGIGYVAPSPSTFPRVDDFIDWVASCNAIPMTTWLDGTSGGESDPAAYLECLRAKGAVALNIIPDRNWNIADPEVRAVKVANLNAVVAAANAMDLPVNIGTEMNKRGLPFVDSLEVESLAPHKETFLSGARIMVGHTLLLRYAGMSYIGEKAQTEFTDVKARNAFFERVGAGRPLTSREAQELANLENDAAYAWFRDRAGR
jgi:hypothetical protein